MFDKLIESNPKARIGGKFGGGTSISVVVHVLLIWGAVEATFGSGNRDAAKSLDTTMVFIQQEEEKKQEQEEVKLEEVKGFTALLAPVNIPTNIPPINLNEKWDPSQFSGVGVEKGFNLTTDVKIDPGAAFNEAIVDEKPSLVSPILPEYPDLLRQAGIEGTVLVEVIIDTTGHSEPASLKIVQSSNRAFELAAKEAVLKSLYRPGRVRGQAVRVLVQVPINFGIRR